MRGKGMHTTKASPDQRITPAYAGKRTGLICKYPLVRDHPRLCGEKDRANKKMHVVQGSPPPMRGKAIFARYFSARSGITPAYAGKSYRQSGRQRDTRDHPRLCGEKRIHLSHFRVMYGITPAYAGKSLFPQDILHRT